ncbi:DNA/RNA helicase domain-containing protein [Oerskovia paurometabola]|uniref:DNA/RNA helicase domain-containing protein n=1 Tax=Oerskovia paurometabola TaxID=162170 RepID=UPI0034325189
MVYILDGPGTGRGGQAVYVGESTNAGKRFVQHLANKRATDDGLATVRVILDETFNKSVCHDLESHLIRLFAGDGKFQVLNRNDGIVDADYFERERYRQSFEAIFEQLLADGLFSKSITAITNSDLFKLSPFKALTSEQAMVIEEIVGALLTDIEGQTESTAVIEGFPGTGKTIVAIFLLKLMTDIATRRASDDTDADSLFADFFQDGNADLLTGLRFGLVVPQQSLRTSIRAVFRRTPGLDPTMVLSPFEVGSADHDFDLLVVDETHRLNQRANQASGPLNRKFQQITESLFGQDDHERTQLDWIRAKSRHQIFLVDGAQSVRPADLPEVHLDELSSSARTERRHYTLTSQMRVHAEGDYVGFVRRLLTSRPQPAGASTLAAPAVSGYDFRLFDDLSEMRAEILRLDDEHGLSRLVAGFAWPWASKKNRTAHDIEIDGLQLFWNRTDKDWINSPTSREEVGSIHTVQGYDLNYAGVIIGPDLTYDPVEQRLKAVRDSYFDKKGKENVPRLGSSYTEDNLLRYITNAYAVLLTRGIRGTFVYVCDPALRRFLAQRIG